MNVSPFYKTLLAQLDALTEGEPCALPNLCNAASLLYTSLADVNWAGFYLLRGETLVLGPFGGKPACIRIPLGRGVCGTAAQARSVQRVPNVHEFPGHIACDGASNSEIVIPLLRDGALLGVLDIDSPVFDRFSEADEAGLTAFADRIAALLTAPLL